MGSWEGVRQCEFWGEPSCMIDYVGSGTNVGAAALFLGFVHFGSLAWRGAEWVLCWGFRAVWTRRIFPKTDMGHAPCLRYPVREMPWV